MKKPASAILRTADLKARSPRWLLDTADRTTRTIALATAVDRPVPDFVIAGTKRGGTTSLFNYLLQHPGLLGTYPASRGRKSTDFFFADSTESSRWYRSHFHSETYRRLRRRSLGYRPLGFEASPYYMWDLRVAAKASELVPNLKSIFILRDPVRRAWSHYQERVQNGVEPLSFADALDAEPARLAGETERMATDPGYHSNAHDWYAYRSRGEYLPQVTNWHSSFPADQLLVLRSEDLYTSTQDVMDQICSFLGVPAFVLPSTTAHNATWRTRDQVPEAQAHDLRLHYRPHNQALADYLGRPLEWDAWE